MTNKPEILVLFGGGFSPHLQSIQQELKKLGHESLFGNYEQLVYRSENNSQPAKLLWDGHDLKQFKLIFFRLIGARWELVTLINTYLKEEIKAGKVKLIDPLAVSLKRYYGLKLAQNLALKKEGLPVPKTVWGHLEKLKTEIPEQLGFPAVIKRSGGSHGENVYLVKNKQELNQVLTELKPQEEKENKRFIGQEYIPNQGDFRVLVLGDQTLGAIKRQRTQDQFRNNVSRGGAASVVEELTDDLKQIAIKAAQAVDLTFAGVDIVLREGDNQPFIFEVNRSPQFNGFMQATGINVPAKIAKFLADQKEKIK
jgi:RimK family alpha-L-glutamate ligase